MGLNNLRDGTDTEPRSLTFWSRSGPGDGFPSRVVFVGISPSGKYMVSAADQQEAENPKGKPPFPMRKELFHKLYTAEHDIATPAELEEEPFWPPLNTGGQQ
ncbi:hypothetical protein [Longispora urticae]